MIANEQDGGTIELDGDERELLVVYKAGQDMGVGRQARIWGGIEARLDKGEAVEEPREHERPVSFWRAHALALTVAAAACVLVAISVGRGMSRHEAAQGEQSMAPHNAVHDPTSGRVDSRSPQVVTPHDPGQIVNEPPKPAIVTAGPLDPEAEPADPPPATPRKAPPREGPSASSMAREQQERPGDNGSQYSSLDQETELLDRARAALASDKPGEAKAWLRQHARLHRDGALVEEREALDVIAICTLGEASARTALESFLTRFSSSPHVRTVRSACEDLDKGGSR